MSSGISDEKLNDLAEAIATDTNLATLGLKLGFRQSKVDVYIKTNKRNDNCEGTSTMLFDWKRKTSRTEQITKLVKAMKESDMVELAEEFFPEEDGSSSVQGAASTSAAKTSSMSSASTDFDDILTQVAQQLHKREEIDKLGKALGFGPADIGRYYDANEKQGGTYMGTLDMLRKWRNRQPATEERTEFKKALSKADFVRLASELLKDD